jgi:hypothetical protein
VVLLRITKPSRDSGGRNGAGDPLRLCLTALSRRQPSPVATGASENGARERAFLVCSCSAPAAAVAGAADINWLLVHFMD